jgi:hypothetical protein
MKYSCEKCHFFTVNRNDWNRHLNTDRHIINCCEEEESRVPKQFICVICNYSTDVKSNYTKHLSSKKHKHKQNEKKAEEQKKMEQLVVSLVDQRLAEHEPQATTIINNITNNNNNHIVNNHTMNTMNNTLNDQKFNLNVFLNEDCKNAMNLTDFINNISLTLTDLENTARLGYTDGITKIINDRIRDIGEKGRPYHCTDKKRQTVYVKDDDLWEKELDDKPKIKKMISEVIHKNIAQLSDWKKANPECHDISNGKGEEYLSIMVEANGGPHREEKEDQILKNVIESVTV